jgi:hypothetical protein
MVLIRDVWWFILFYCKTSAILDRHEGDERMKEIQLILLIGLFTFWIIHTPQCVRMKKVRYDDTKNKRETKKGGTNDPDFSFIQYCTIKTYIKINETVMLSKYID